MRYQKIHCPYCNSIDVRLFGKTTTGKQRYFCKNSECQHQTFLLEYTREGDKPGIKSKIVNMVMNGSGTRDTARVLGINKDTVTRTLKKLSTFVNPVNEKYLNNMKTDDIDIVVTNPLDLTVKPFTLDKTVKKTKKHQK